MSPTSVNGTQLPLHGTDDLDQIVTVLREHVHALSERSSRAPSAVRLSARGVELEMTWPDAPLPHAYEHPRTSAPEPAPAAAPAETAEADTFVLCAETVGVFYRAPEPGAKPFVNEGDTVQPGTQIAIVEAMKLMIPVEADRAGTVMEVLVADGESVEHGQPLMKLAPAEPGGTTR
ncbi:acetyl-CoA carboxylase biotin carboxyl carrier protein subunit [Saccharopolyspora sp. ASAGF58]|uniref:acetyl-CoA carboxylase biotin carboxyl carrier protein n=1 Tax=Saccharopolyspora sp. ASAGF58 TaxID=2719023 RepID=UPI00143FD189|nr:acetyl-CoA carboxylase biotin carboxyl carrier protein subunit [Saccharopolyspora sp. ASAGF58]QIZ38708.1 acetyl-CoA carboxylase biotin carboxyl carrier protein subunit [Saccharopolyspora sp. ASAGF58]